MSKKNRNQEETLMVTTGIKGKTVFLEVECPNAVVSGKVLAIIDYWVDVLKFNCGGKS